MNIIFYFKASWVFFHCKLRVKSYMIVVGKLRVRL